MMKLRSITVQQPFASLIACGLKRIETRSWSTNYRGPLVIHAGAVGASLVAATAPWERMAEVLGMDDGYELWHQHAAGADYVEPTLPFLPFGAIVATAQLLGCVPIIDYRDVDHHHDHRDALPRQGRWLANGGGLVLWRQEGHVRDELDDYSDQRPFGDFTPGRWAWLLDDIKPTTERCPACWACDLCGSVRFRAWPEDPCERMCQDCFHVCAHPTCSVCHGRRRTDPIPARGRRGLWCWEPPTNCR